MAFANAKVIKTAIVTTTIPMTPMIMKPVKLGLNTETKGPLEGVRTRD
jgi:hypothetical protein